MLEDKDNFIQWHRKFRRTAIEDGVWALLQGESTVMTTEPNLNHYLQAVQTALRPENLNAAFDTNTHQPRNNAYIRQRMPGYFETTQPTQQSGFINTDEIAGMATELAMFRYERDCEKFEQDKAKLKTIYRLLQASVQASILRTTNINQTDPISGYKRLVDTFKGSNHHMGMSLMRELCDLRLVQLSRQKHLDRNSAVEYLRAARDLQMDLKDYGHILSDEDICEQILWGLPESWNSFCASYETVMRVRGTPDGHDIEILSQRLIEECEQRHKLCKVHKH